MAILCNDCKQEVKYINCRKKDLPIKCKPTPIKIIQESGRIVEGYELHECGTTTSDKIPKEENETRNLWVGGNSLQ